MFHNLQAEKRMIEAEENKEYLPIEGLADFRKATLQLLLGSAHPAVKEVSCCLVSPVLRFNAQSHPFHTSSAPVHAKVCSMHCMNMYITSTWKYHVAT